MHVLVIAMVLGASPLLDSEVSAGVGVLGTGYTGVGARLGDAFVTPSIGARGVFGNFVIDGAAFTSSPLRSARASFSGTASVRIGATGERWAVMAGVVGQYAPDARPRTLILPTLRGQVSFGQVGLSLGVFDLLGLVPAHLSVDFGPFTRGRFSVGWVAPVGLLASGELSIARGFGVRVTAFAFRLTNTETAMLVVSGTFGAGGAR
ncbi:MAG: hypothetical protein Q8L14_22705 [Myxococcales bacterium]|nr:hypothetical protein [Myxococcales bacterium]